jgi:hypothetical protein
MDVDRMAKQFCASRIGFGAGLILAPGLYGRFWAGPGASRRWSRMLSRALGARELALGAGGLAALRGSDEQQAVQWMLANGLTEAADVVANLAAGPRTPARLAGAALAAANAAIAAAYVAERRA